MYGIFMYAEVNRSLSVS